jgi:hypothetical protein
VAHTRFQRHSPDQPETLLDQQRDPTSGRMLTRNTVAREPKNQLAKPF